MEPTFKLWSETNPAARLSLKPDLGMRGWDDLNEFEKDKIWRHFINKKWFKESQLLFHSVSHLNEKYKKASFGELTLNHSGPHIESGYLRSCCLANAYQDFVSIFHNNVENVVYELLSIYAYVNINQIDMQNSEHYTDIATKKEYIESAYEDLDKFAADFNDIFEQFSLNVVLTRRGILFRQEKKIIDDVYIPVISFLSGTGWKGVNRDLNDAFSKFQLKTPQGYSSCVTHSISALQAFLQIIVYKKVGKGELGNLIAEAQKAGLIPNDSFTSKIFKDIESILMEERQKTGDPHPKKEYANEKTAKLILNLIMVFIQHCMIN